MTHHRRIVPTLLSGAVIGACASSALIAQNSLVFVPVRADVVMSADMQKQIGVDRLTPAQRFALDTWLTRYTAEIRADEAAAVRGDDASEPAPAAVTSAHGDYHVRTTPVGVRLSATRSGGGYVRLEDGSLWEVYLPDRPHTDTWRRGDYITVSIAGAGVGEYDHFLLDVRSQSRALARFAGVSER